MPAIKLLYANIILLGYSSYSRYNYMEIGNYLYPSNPYQKASGQNNDPSGPDIPGKKSAKDPQQKTDSDVQQQKIQEEVQKLKAVEEKVIAHEMAHKSVGGQYAGAVHYEYKAGPDGRSYIAGGEVPIDVSDERTPEETMQKMAIVRRAALAPVDPSPQDQKVAAEAAIKEQNALLESLKQKYNADKSSKSVNLSVFA